MDLKMEEGAPVECRRRRAGKATYSLRASGEEHFYQNLDFSPVRLPTCETNTFLCLWSSVTAAIEA